MREVSKRSLRLHGWRTRLGALIAIGIGTYALFFRPTLDELPTCQVIRGQLQIVQIEGGEIQAASGEVVAAPRIGSQLKIEHLWPEGTRVEAGDLLVQFDPAEFEREVLNEEGRLERAQTDYERAKVEKEQRLSEFKKQLQQAQFQFDLAKLNLERARFSPLQDQERAQIEMERAARSLTDTEDYIDAQEVANRVDLNRSAREVARAQERYDRARKNYGQTRIYASRPGIVVHRRKQSGNRMEKVKVGDVVFGGQALVEIPELSAMQVRCLVDEVDIKRMQVGQPAAIRLEAFPGPVFRGQVAQLAPMATPQPGAPDIQVFELMIGLHDQDERLRPGMSAQAEIILETLPDVLSVPLAAVFEQDGAAVVYCLRQGEFARVPVELGRRNATDAEIRAGLREGEVVALRPPGRR